MKQSALSVTQLNILDQFSLFKFSFHFKLHRSRERRTQQRENSREKGAAVFWRKSGNNTFTVKLICQTWVQIAELRRETIQYINTNTKTVFEVAVIGGHFGNGNLVSTCLGRTHVPKDNGNFQVKTNPKRQSWKSLDSCSISRHTFSEVWQRNRKAKTLTRVRKNTVPLFFHVKVDM